MTGSATASSILREHAQHKHTEASNFFSPTSCFPPFFCPAFCFPPIASLYHSLASSFVSPTFMSFFSPAHFFSSFSLPPHSSSIIWLPFSPATLLYTSSHRLCLTPSSVPLFVSILPFSSPVYLCFPVVVVVVVVLLLLNSFLCPILPSIPFPLCSPKFIFKFLFHLVLTASLSFSLSLSLCRNQWLFSQ